MKKLIAILLILSSLAMLFAACGKEDEKNKALSELTLEDILAAIYDKGGYGKMLTSLIEAPVPEEDDFTNYLVTTEITDSNCAYFLGKADIEFERAIASEASLNPTTYSLCLVKAKEGQDVEALADTIKKNADPMKWVCTGVSPDHVYVEHIGDIVILIMSGTDGEALLEAFRSLARDAEQA